MPYHMSSGQALRFGAELCEVTSEFCSTLFDLRPPLDPHSGGPAHPAPKAVRVDLGTLSDLLLHPVNKAPPTGFVGWPSA